MTSFAKFIISVVLFVWVTLLSLPYLLYWYGLFQLPAMPKPTSTKQLSTKEKLRIWRLYKGKGPALVKPFGPYDYLGVLSCIANVPSDKEKPVVISGCYQEFSGFEHVMTLVEQSIGKPVKPTQQKNRSIKGKSVNGQHWLKTKELQQVIIFSSQAIWISQNWSTEQILASLATKVK